MSRHDHRKTYRNVLITLLTLTVITVAVARIDLGILNIVIAIGIATVKGSLVCLYFMHLKYDNKLNQVVFASAFAFLILFAALTLSDLLMRETVDPYHAVLSATEDRASSLTSLH